MEEILRQKPTLLYQYLKAQAMKNMNPGLRFGMAVAIAGEVRLIPFRNRDWHNVTLTYQKYLDKSF